MNSQHQPNRRLIDNDSVNSINLFGNKDSFVDVEDEDYIKFVIFRAGGNLYASYGSDVREILHSREIYPVPFLPEYLPGLINVRGDIESALDICFFLGGTRAAKDRVLIMMVKRDLFCTGIIVDDIEDVVDIPLSIVKPPLATLSGRAKELISGSIDFSGTTVPILDIAKLADRVSI